MFLNTSKFKKAVKKAYEGNGIYILQRNRCYVLDAGWWFLQVPRDSFTKENMAAVISIVGNLPEEGEMNLYRKGESPQETMVDTYCQFLNIVYENATEEYIRTNVLFRTQKTFVEILQDRQSRVHLLVPEAFMAMMDTGKMEEQEYMQSEYGRTSEGDKVIIWASDRMLPACRKRPCRYYGEQNFMDKICNTDLAWSWGQSEEISLT